MGSPIRTEVGSNFEMALGLLRGAIEKRIRNTTELDDTTTKEMKSGLGEDIDAKSTVADGEKGFDILVFSKGRYDLLATEMAVQSHAVKMRQQLSCTDYVTPSDLLRNVLASSNVTDAMKVIQRAIMCNQNIGEEDVDYEPIIARFIELLQSSDDDATTKLSAVRHLLSCLVVNKIPSEAAQSMGELVGKYAPLVCVDREGDNAKEGSTGSHVTNAMLTVLSSLSSTDGEGSISVLAAAKFVQGYTKDIKSTGGSSKQSKQRMAPTTASVVALSSLEKALQSNGSIKSQLPVVPGVGKKDSSASSKVIKKQLKIWKSWSERIIVKHGGVPKDDDDEEEKSNLESAAAGRDESKKLSEEHGVEVEDEEMVSSKTKRGKKLPTLPEDSELNDTEEITPPVQQDLDAKKRKDSISSSIDNEEIGGQCICQPRFRGSWIES